MASRPVAAGRPSALLGEETHDLADEERIALGLLVNRRHELRGRDLGGWCDRTPPSSLTQPAQREATDDRLPGDLGKHLSCRRPPGVIDVPIGRQDQHRDRAKLARYELKEEQRPRVGRVKVVQDEDEWPAAPCAAQELRGRVEQAEAGSIQAPRHRLRQIGEGLRSDCTHGQYAGAPASQQRPTSTRAPRPGLGDQLLGEPALADARLAHRPGTGGRGRPPRR